MTGPNDQQPCLLSASAAASALIILQRMMWHDMLTTCLIVDLAGSLDQVYSLFLPGSRASL
jgi:hypothetical protein